MDILMRHAWSSATLLLLGACTGGGNGARAMDASPSVTAGRGAAMLDDKLGNARIEGDVAGISMDAPRAALTWSSPYYAIVKTGIRSKHTAIQVSSMEASCSDTAWPEGSVLVVDLFQNPSAPVSEVTEPGSFRTWVPSINEDEEIPTGNRAIVAFGKRDSAKGSQLWFAQSGEVTINRIADGHLTGTLDVFFKAGSLKGAFDAAACDTWARGTNSIP